MPEITLNIRGMHHDWKHIDIDILVDAVVVRSHRLDHQSLRQEWQAEDGRRRVMDAATFLLLHKAILSPSDSPATVQSRLDSLSIEF